MNLPNVKVEGSTVTQPKVSNHLNAGELGLSSGIQMIKGMDWNVRKLSFAFIVITIMVLIGLDNIQNQISDRSSYQQTLSSGQTLSAEVQNFINKDLAAVTGTDASKGQTSLPWNASNTSDLQTMMKNISSIYYSNNTGSTSDTWGSMEIILPDGTSIPLMEQTSSGYVMNPALDSFAQSLRSWMTGTPAGAVNWTQSGAIPSLGSGSSAACRMPGDTFSSAQSLNELAGMQPPLYMVLAFKKLQTLVDTDYDLKAPDVTASKLEQLFGGFDSDAPLKGFKSLYNDMNQSQQVTFIDGHPVNVNFLNVVAYYTRSSYNDPMANFWNSTASGVFPSGYSIADLSTGSMEYIFEAWGKQYYNNKNPPSGTAPTTAQSPLDVIATDAGQAQTYSQSSTQANTAEINQAIQTSQSEDKVAQSIVTQSSQTISGMVKNQLVT